MVGAWLAWGSFALLGGAAYLVPWLAGIFGVSYLLHFQLPARAAYLALFWAFVLLICFRRAVHGG